MIGFLGKWECPVCGNILKRDSPFWNKDLRKKIQEPKKCGCGRKGSFNLIGFEQCQYELLPEGYKIVNTSDDEEVKEEEKVEE